jgi:hypothetical protein
MEQSPSKDSNIQSVSQEIPFLLWNLKVHKSLSLNTILSQWIVYILTPCFYILITSCNLCLGLQRRLFPSTFPKNLLCPTLCNMLVFYGVKIGKTFLNTHQPLADIFTYVPQLKVERRFSRYSNVHCSSKRIAWILSYQLQTL